MRSPKRSGSPYYGAQSVLPLLDAQEGYESGKRPRERDSLLLKLSREAAERLRERDLFDARPLNCEDVLKQLGLTLRFENNLQVQGMLLRLREVVIRARI